MAVRTRSRWHEDDKPRSPKEIAGLLAANSWKIATDRAVNLHSKNFTYRDDPQRLAVIGEFLIFQAMVIDRLIYEQIDNNQRGELVTELVLRMALHVEENSQNMIGPGEYQAPFIDTFNRRTGEYAECQFDLSSMNYPFTRCFGAEIQNIMGESADNRWVIDQVMDVDANEISKLIQRNLKQLDLPSLFAAVE